MVESDKLTLSRAHKSCADHGQKTHEHEILKRAKGRPRLKRHTAQQQGQRLRARGVNNALVSIAACAPELFCPG